MAKGSFVFPEIPVTAKFAILFPTFRWGAEVKSILASFCGVAREDVVVLVADNSENPDKHQFLAKLNEINSYIISFFHKKNIGALENFYFIHEWSKEIEFTAIMADDDAVSPVYYLDGYDFLKRSSNVSCVSVGTSFADFGDHRLLDISQISMIGESPVDRMKFWNGFSARITAYDVGRRGFLDGAIGYLKSTPVLGMTLVEDLFELNRLAYGNFVRERGRGFFVHYPHHGSHDGDSLDRFYKLLCKDLGLSLPMIRFMGVSTAVQCALFLLGKYSPIEDLQQRYQSAQHVFKFLFFNGFCQELQQGGLLLNLRKWLADDPACLKGLNKYAASNINDLIFDANVLKWFIDIIKVFEFRAKIGETLLSRRFSNFCADVLDVDVNFNNKKSSGRRGDKLSQGLAWLDELNAKFQDFLPDDIGQWKGATVPAESAGPGVAPQPTWSVTDWFKDRTPSPARARLLRSLVDAHPDVGTLGVLVILPDELEPEALSKTLDSLYAQSQPLHKIWVIGKTAPAMLPDDLFEYLPAESHWAQPLAERISQEQAPDFIWILYPGDQLLPHAALLFGEYRLRHPDPLVWYADEAMLENGVPSKPMLKPDFNLDLLRSYPYIGRNLILSTAAIQAVGGLQDAYGQLAAQDLAWRLVERVGPQLVGHIPEVAIYAGQQLFSWMTNPDVASHVQSVTQAHLDRIGNTATIHPIGRRGESRLEYPILGEPLVSIIIPTRDQLPVLQVCVESLMEKTAYTHYELLIVDNGSQDRAAVQFLQQLEAVGLEQVRILRWPYPFNFSAINNFAAKQARGDVLLFLNNDTEVVDPEWLGLMLGHALRPEVGAVGARLDYLDGRVQHAGLVLGMDNSVGFGFRGESSHAQGYMNRLVTTQNVGAVSASCMMMRRDVYQELDGFDETNFPVFYGDADLCLRLTQAGYLITQAAEVRLKHMGGATRLLTEQFGQDALPDLEQGDRLYAKWLPKLVDDPSYHPAFGRLSPGFSLSREASRIYRPLPGRPLPVVLASHGDWHGCGHYRIIHPFQALESEGRLEGGLKDGNFHFTDVAGSQPDTVILQGAWGNPGILDEIRRIQDAVGAKVLLEFDDYLPNVPVRSMYRQSMPRDLIKMMRRAIERVDWLVVSTPVLAQEYSAFHPEIRVAYNGLPKGIWGGLSSQRRTGKKLRLGWAGGSSHTGDLAIIRALVKDMEDEVDWVFMGMQPEDIRCEFHPGVEISKYPAALAALNLDLALVPLEMNQFNRSKSNLRLLELGACGVPIICTDIEPYRCDLPVTRVRNRYQDWEKAVREHLAEPEALARQGDALQAAVRQSWMLEGAFLDQWMAAWL